MSYRINEDDIPDEMIGYQDGPDWIGFGVDKEQVARLLRDAIDVGLVSPPCYYIAYPSGMLVMHEPGEPIQIFPGKCTEPHERHWKGQTE